MKIAFITFNLEKAGRYANGPGMCLFNFIKILKSAGHNVEVYSKLPSKYAKPLHTFPFKKKFDIVHHWSGTSKEFSKFLTGDLNFVGPNVLDTVYMNKEVEFLNSINSPVKFLAVNPIIKNKIFKAHKINKIGCFMVGPDFSEWFPIRKEKFILWKGNAKQYAKDIEFALQVKNKLKEKYKFVFLGYPKPYHYLEHINLAKKAKVYFSSSISETMGLTVLEQMACKTPVVAHPNIYMSGIDFETGRVIKKDLGKYCEAIDSLMNDENLWEKTSEGALNFVKVNFNNEKIYSKYQNLIRN